MGKQLLAAIPRNKKKMEEDEHIVKAYPCLYDTKSADFKIALKKENAWKTIANALGNRPGNLDMNKI